MNKAIKYWIGVACKEHVEHGVKLGVAQFCHGKIGPAKRLSCGDYIIYYSSKVVMNGAELYQKFTAIGRVIDDEAYQVDMGNGFMPFRRNIDYFDAQHVDIKPLITELDFIKNKKSWGAAFRYGFLEIDAASFDKIAVQMMEHNF